MAVAWAEVLPEGKVTAATVANVVQ